jgi:hypothetical protein
MSELAGTHQNPLAGGAQAAKPGVSGLAAGVHLAPVPGCGTRGKVRRAPPSPANITFDLLPQLDEPTRQRLRRDKQARHAEVCRRAQVGLEEWVAGDV